MIKGQNQTSLHSEIENSQRHMRSSLKCVIQQCFELMGDAVDVCNLSVQDHGTMPWDCTQDQVPSEGHSAEVCHSQTAVLPLLRLIQLPVFPHRCLHRRGLLVDTE